jgi:ribose/xylose/arabinose/galactoside ABC-type transport system permease subunit
MLGASGWRRQGRSTTAGLALLWLVVLVVFSTVSASFRTGENAQNLLLGYSHIAILAIGMTFPIILAGIDLSIGSVLGLVGMSVFDLSIFTGVPGPVIVLIALAEGALLGALNGFLIVRFALSPFIVTLAGYATWRGATYWISGRQLRPGVSTAAIDDPALLTIDGVAGPIPAAFLYLVVLAAAAHFLMQRTRLGRDLYSVGGNPRAAHLAGINVMRVHLIAYGISGLTAAIGALILTSRQLTSTEDLGTGFELSAIAAAVVGGVSLLGGVGGALGPVIGAFLVGTLSVGLTFAGVTTYAQQIVSGVILVGAVGFDRWREVRARRRLLVERSSGRASQRGGGREATATP